MNSHAHFPNAEAGKAALCAVIKGSSRSVIAIAFDMKQASDGRIALHAPHFFAVRTPGSAAFVADALQAFARQLIEDQPAAEPPEGGPTL